MAMTIRLTSTTDSLVCMRLTPSVTTVSINLVFFCNSSSGILASCPYVDASWGEARCRQGLEHGRLLLPSSSLLPVFLGVLQNALQPVRLHLHRLMLTPQYQRQQSLMLAENKDQKSQRIAQEHTYA